MVKCDTCIKNLRRYNGREIECNDLGRRGQKKNHCDNYVTKMVHKFDRLAWAEQ